jgi:predicted dehydrogenase
MNSGRVDVAGWVDVRPGVATEAAQMRGLNGIHTGTDLEKALQVTRPDFVANVTAPPGHRDVAITAMEAGVPVVCEKPLADNMEHARDMVAASERTGQLLMVSQQRRYDPRIRAMRKLIEDRVGPLSILNSDFYRGHPQHSFHTTMPSPLLLDMAIHTFDAARYISGADPISVYCEDFNSDWSWWNGNASAIAIFEMTDGLRYTYRGSWSSPGHDTTWESEWRAVGPNGTVVWDGLSSPVADVVVGRDEYPMKTKQVRGRVDPRAPIDLPASLAVFLHALDTGEVPSSECHDNIKSLAMVFGAIESARTGKRVTIEHG